MTAPARVIVADDAVLLREGLASLLERSGFDVVGQADDGTELLTLTRELVPEHLDVGEDRVGEHPAGRLDRVEPGEVDV